MRSDLAAAAGSSTRRAAAARARGRVSDPQTRPPARESRLYDPVVGRRRGRPVPAAGPSRRCDESDIGPESFSEIVLTTSVSVPSMRGVRGRPWRDQRGAQGVSSSESAIGRLCRLEEMPRRSPAIPARARHDHGPRGPSGDVLRPASYGLTRSLGSFA